MNRPSRFRSRCDKQPKQIIAFRKPLVPAKVYPSSPTSCSDSKIPRAHSRDLLPLRIKTQQRANRTRDSHHPIIELGQPQSGRRDSKIAQIAQQLQPHSVRLARNLLGLDDGLGLCGFRRRELGAAFAQAVELVQGGEDAERDAGDPGFVAFAGEARRGGVFVDVGGVQLCSVSLTSPSNAPSVASPRQEQERYCER